MKFIKKIGGWAFLFLLTGLLFVGVVSCKKYLDKKPSQALVIPSTLKDLQALLDPSILYSSSPGYLEFVADNYYVTSASWNATRITEWRTGYIWDKDALVDNSTWNEPYEAVYYSNVVLDYLPTINIQPSEKASADQIKGDALFYRSFIFYQLAQLFCKPYSTSSNTDPAIVLRTTSAIEAPTARATVRQTYDQVIGDLKTAAELLPLNAAAVTRPNKVAAYGLLSRIYLSMRDYDSANVYANKALLINSTLLDYNVMSPSGRSSLPLFTSNPEIQFASCETLAPSLVTNPSDCKIDSVLYQSYDANDLRKTVFFRPNGNSYYWMGGYFNAASLESFVFDGIANDEIILIRAECRARSSDVAGALNDLNGLLHKRWKTGTFTDFTANDASIALSLILTERRKELLFRGLRWTDLRRFNLEGANITLKRIINGTTYILPPNDLRWTLLIPSQELSRSGISQNPR